MGPFPHDAPKAEITEANPAGTDGFEFVEFAHEDADACARPSAGRATSTSRTTRPRRSSSGSRATSPT